MTPTPEGIINTSDIWTAPTEPVEQELPEVVEEAKDDLPELS